MAKTDRVGSREAVGFSELGRAAMKQRLAEPRQEACAAITDLARRAVG